MHLGVALSELELWQSVLSRLSDLAPWLARTNAVSVHRCNDLIGCSPDEWNAWIEGSHELPIGGRLGRLLLADIRLTSAAPIASEWALQQQSEQYVEIQGFDDSMEISSLNIRGRIDRVDSVVFSDEVLEQLNGSGLAAEDAETIPLILSLIHI